MDPLKEVLDHGVAVDGSFKSVPLKGLWNYVRRLPERRTKILPVILAWSKESETEITKPLIISIIKRLRERRRFRHALELGEWMLEQEAFEIRADEHALILDLCARSSRVNSAQSKFLNLPLAFQTEKVYNGVLAYYGRKGQISKLQEQLGLLEKMGVEKTVLSHNALIMAHCVRGQLDKAKEIFESMQAEGYVPNIITYNVLLTGLGKSGDIQGMEDTFARMADANIPPDLVTNNSMLWIYFLHGQTEKAEAVVAQLRKNFRVLPESTFSSLLWAYANAGNVEKMNAIWAEMSEALVPLLRQNHFARIQGYGNAKDPEMAEQMFKEMVEAGHLPVTQSYNALIYAYTQNGLMDKAMNVLATMENGGMKRDNVTYQYLLRGFIQRGDFEEAIELMKAAVGSYPHNLVKPRFNDFLPIVLHFVEEGDVERVKELLLLTKTVYRKDAKSYNLLIRAYIAQAKKTGEGGDGGEISEVVKATPELESGVRSVLEELKKSKLRGNVETVDLLGSIGLKGLIEEVGIPLVKLDARVDETGKAVGEEGEEGEDGVEVKA